MPRMRNGSGLRPRISAAVLRAQTDGRLAALACSGNEQAFGAIFDRYAGELRAHARQIVRVDRADDVVQQAMLSAWMAMGGGPKIVDFRAWLHRIVRNCALDQVAKRGYDDREIPVTIPGPMLTDVRAETQIAAAGILEAVAALSDNQRRALTLTALEGLSGRETAQTMGMSETAVRQLVHRARSTVRSAVSAITPLPLISWIGEVGPEAAGRGAAGLGGGAGLTAGTLKVVAVLSVSGTTIAAITPGLQHPHRNNRPAEHRVLIGSASHAWLSRERMAVASITSGAPASAGSGGVASETPSGGGSRGSLSADGGRRKHHSERGEPGRQESGGRSGAQDGSSGERGGGPSERSAEAAPRSSATNGDHGGGLSDESAHAASQSTGADSGQLRPAPQSDGSSGSPGGDSGDGSSH